MSGDHNIRVRLGVAATGAIVLLVPAALIGVLVVGNVGWLHRFDLNVTAAGHRFAVTHAGWVQFMKVWSVVFHPDCWRVAVLLLAIWLIRRGAWRLAVWAGLTMTAGGVLGAVLKVLVGRHRPDLLDPVARASGYSFPSGHALNNALGAAIFLLVLLPLVRDRPRARALLCVAAAVISLVAGLCRIGLGVHWPSDVVAGWLLGAAVPAITAWAYLAWPSRRSPKVDAAGVAR